MYVYQSGPLACDQFPNHTIHQTMLPTTFTEICERNSGQLLTLVHSTTGGAGKEVEEFILRLQGYMVEAMLPPIRQQR